MDNIQYLIGEFSWVDVVSVGVVGDERNVQRPNVRNQWKSLQEVMLICVNCMFQCTC